MDGLLARAQPMTDGQWYLLNLTKEHDMPQLKIHVNGHCYGPVYLDSRRPDCSEPWAFISPLFIPDENARIAAKQFGSRQVTVQCLGVVTNGNGVQR